MLMVAGRLGQLDMKQRRNAAQSKCEKTMRNVSTVKRPEVLKDELIFPVVDINSSK